MSRPAAFALPSAGRTIDDLWEFVAFAETEHPELDLLTPPKRPEKK